MKCTFQPATRLGVRLAGVLYALLLIGSARAVAAQGVDGVGFSARISADTVYVGEQLTYTLSVQIPQAVRQRLRRNPEFVPPDARGMLAYDLPLVRRSEGEESAETHMFRRALFVLSPGRYSIGAARLSYGLPQTTSFFSREEERTLRAEALSFVAVEPPRRGRPPEWTGAVGEWQASARAEPPTSRVGDPFVLVLRLEGTGNATLLPRPALRIDWADVVPEDERVELDSTPQLLGGAKEFTWLVTPRRSGLQEVPAIAYHYFDPQRRAYRVTQTVATLVSVRPGAVVEMPPEPRARAADERLPLRDAPAGAVAVGLVGAPWFGWLALLAPLPFLVLRLRRRVVTRRSARLPVAVGSARAMLERGLRTRTGVDVGRHTAPGAFRAALQLEGVTAETAAEAEALRDACDAAGFAGEGHAENDAGLRKRAESLLARIDREARRGARALLLPLALGAAVAAAAACARLPSSAAALQSFSNGRTAYVGEDDARARDAFFAAARAMPRDPNAWANLGTAAWAAQDTAVAVLGWQKALRLTPTDATLRDHLRRVRAPQSRGAARVWPLPPLPFAVAALLLWLAGWAWALLRQRQRASPWVAGYLLGPAVLLALGGWYLDEQLAARDLVVIAQPTALRSLPALGAEQGAVPLTGEVARVRERRGVWLHVSLDGGRAGWFPTERTWSLARD